MIVRRKKSDSKQISGEELLDAMSSTNDYEHLQVFLGYNLEARAIPQRYLMVTPSYFGIVNLLDLEYEKEKVVIYLQDDKTKVCSKVYLDIHDNSYKFLLLRWSDILDLVLKDSTNKDNDLLELE